MRILSLQGKYVSLFHSLLYLHRSPRCPNCWDKSLFQLGDVWIHWTHFLIMIVYFYSCRVLFEMLCLPKGRKGLYLLEIPFFNLLVCWLKGCFAVMTNFVCKHKLCIFCSYLSYILCSSFKILSPISKQFMGVVLSLLQCLISAAHTTLAPRCCFPSLGLTLWRGRRGRRRRSTLWPSVSRLGRLR